MKILFIHTYYHLKGGEDTVFEQESALLLKSDEVEVCTFRNKTGLKGGIQFLTSICNFNTLLIVGRVIRRFKPDIIHIHNTHFAAGPIIIQLAAYYKIPIVVTLHNYRLLCPSGILQYDGNIYTDSLNKTFPWISVWRGVYRNSVTQTFWLSLINYFHKKIGTWNKVDRFIVLTAFAESLFLSSNLGLKPKQIIVKPNFVQGIGCERNERNNHFLFVGRLTEEKGILDLIKAFIGSNLSLKIAGDGPLIDAVLSACSLNLNITYLGSLERHEVARQMKECSALIFPSKWYEGMPMTIIESFSFGTPVIATDLGAMSSMVTHQIDGLLFPFKDISALGETIKYYSNLPLSAKSEYEQNAHKTYLSIYTPEANFIHLVKIYNDLMVESIH